MRRATWTTMILLAALVVLSACASPDYLAIAEACGNSIESECLTAWDDWNDAEDRREAKEARVRRVQACADAGGIMTTYQHGALKGEVCRDKAEVERDLRNMIEGQQ